MSASHPLIHFRQWLLASAASSSPSRTIVVHGGTDAMMEELVVRIADYLNEYDGEGAGRWLAVTDGLVGQVAESPDLRGMLGLTEQPNGGMAASADDICGVLTVLGQRGHVVFRADATREHAPDLPTAFHAGIGPARACGKCHLILDPELVQLRNLAHMVSDVFLDWHHGLFRSLSVPSSRNASPSAIEDQT